MKTREALISIFTLISFFASGQLSLNVKELDYLPVKKEIPAYDYHSVNENRYRDHILEITLSNTSDKTLLLPLDTLSYALPFSENTKDFYRRGDYRSDPDVFNSLAVHGFLYQNKEFIEGQLDGEGFLDIFPSQEQLERKVLEDRRIAELDEWKNNFNFSEDLKTVYNWYLVKSMILIPAKSAIKYKIYFNPFRKNLKLFGYHEFYWKIDPTKAYDVNFKIILNKNLYKMLTKQDKKKYKNLFVGVISSNTLTLTTAEIK